MPNFVPREWIYAVAAEVSGSDTHLRKYLGIAAVLLLLCSGCAAAISKEMRDLIDPELTFHSVFQDPKSHKGKHVLWGGMIIQVLNEEGSTWLELLQQPLRHNHRPVLGRHSEGRFLIRHEGFLDPAIYSPGREITVVGEIQGVKAQSLGEMIYRYPVLSDKQLKLWDFLEESRFHFGIGLGATF